MNNLSSYKGPTSSEAQRLIRERGENAWVELALKYGKNFVYQGTLATCDPRLVEIVLMDRTHTQQRSFVYKHMPWIIPLAPGLLFMDGDEWEKRLRAVMPTFTKARVDAYAEFMHTAVLDHTATWQTDQPFEDLYTLIVQLNIELLLKVGCGLDPKQPIAQELGRALVDFKFHLLDSRTRLDEFGISNRQVRTFPRFLAAQWQRSRKIIQLRSLIRTILAQSTGGSAEDGLNWIQRLHEAGFSLGELTDEVNHLYGAYNALDFTLTSAFYELSRHPEWAEKIRSELVQVMGVRGYPSRSDFERLPNTINFMNEVLRCYPVSMGIARRTGADISLDGLTIPKGQEVLILLYALHHHPDFWDNPTVFNPDRWKSKPTVPYSYVPFLAGPRKCIGQHLAEINFVVVLHALLQRFDITVLDQDVRLAPFMMPRFAKDLRCKVHRRASLFMPEEA